MIKSQWVQLCSVCPKGRPPQEEQNDLVYFQTVHFPLPSTSPFSSCRSSILLSFLLCLCVFCSSLLLPLLIFFPLPLLSSPFFHLCHLISTRTSLKPTLGFIGGVPDSPQDLCSSFKVLISPGQRIQHSGLVGRDTFDSWTWAH